jgi:glyoxylase-like metal-dependent hydrolase (beta-lactamase superfamily II)
MKKFLFILLFFPFYLQAWIIPGVGDFQFESVAKDVYVMHGPLQEPSKKNLGFMNNPGIVLTKKGVILIDPGSSYQVGKHVLAEIKKLTPLPVLAVFNTHIHGDHWLGNQAIKESFPKAKIYAHPAMIAQANSDVGAGWIDIMQRMTEGASKDTQLVAPDKAVLQDEVITVSGHHFKVHSLKPAHTDTDIMIEHIESKTLFMGDNGFNKRLGRFDGSSNMHGAIKLLVYVKRLKLRTFVPGHGNSGVFDVAVKPFQEYLLKLQSIVKAGLERDLEDYEIKEVAIKQLQEYKEWSGFDEQVGKHVFKMYLESQAMEM